MSHLIFGRNARQSDQKAHLAVRRLLTIGWLHLSLLSAAAPGQTAWINPGSGSWTSGANWSSGEHPDAPDAAALFSTAIAMPAEVTVDADIIVNSITFDNATHSYTLSGDGSHSLTLAGAATIDVVAGDHAIAVPLIANESVTKAGGGTLTLSGPNAYTGSTHIETGTLVVENQELPGSNVSVAAGATLRLNQFVDYELPANQTLSGSGDVVLSHTFSLTLLEVVPTAAVRGSLTIRVDDFVNSGRVAPGSSPGVLKIDGDYSQQSNGVLEIEVGGLTPGSQHDQLQVTGFASLGGRLEVPIINGFVPAVNNEITFLTADDVSGTFNAIFSPNLAAISPNLALQVLYGPTSARLRFVAPSTGIQFSATTAEANWSDAATWTTSTVPGATNIITLQNLNPLGETQRVRVTANAFTHQLSVSSGTAPIWLGIESGRNLSAIGGVTIGARGTIELEGGSLVSSAVMVEDGGKLTGSGSVVGNVHVGTTGAQPATFHPGSDATPGLLTIDGNYQQGTSGLLVLDVEGIASGQFSTIHATGEVELGGTLQVNAANLTDFVPGMTFEAIRAGSLLAGSIFDDVETIGRDDIFFAPIYPPGFDLDPVPGTGTGSAVGSGSVFLIGFEKGDMNQDGTVDPDDIPFFALALRDPEAYLKHPQPNGAPCFCHDGQRLGDFTGNGRVDFDDIPHFAERVGMSVPAMLAAIAAYDQAVPEPSTSILAALAAAWFAHGRRRRRIFACMLPLVLLGPAASADAAPARFWLSMSSENSVGPEAPSVVAAPGSIHQLHLWAQPATVKGDEPYHPVDNPFKQLRNFSMNLVTNPLLDDQAVINFLDEAITVYNPVLPGNGRRYEFVHGSTSGLRSTTDAAGVLAGIPDGIRGVQGFSLGVDSDEPFVGIGPDPATGGCRDGDLCAMTTGGPAWLVASLSFQVVAQSGTADYFLQIGRSGISHAGETTGETLVVFGVDAQPVYNAGFVNAESTHREKILPGATVDFRLRAGEALPGDFNGDGVVDAADYTLWRDGLGTAFTAEHYAVWKGDFGLAIGSAVGGSPASVPEPTAAGLLAAVWMLHRRRRHRLVEG